MSYTVLAVKWRPKRFDQLVGQAHVVTALVNSLAAERLHHAYLFSGTRGVGKTTIARILAKALNCESGVSAEPCGECAACVAIDEGRFVDLIEVDAASRTKVDDTRELLDNVQYMPTRGRYKVYLVDEVHMLSNHSFNALLKTLEEPPPHVKFLFATTDPQKLPVTVLSRCLQFNLKKLPLGQIQGQLRTICDAEGIDAADAGLQALARAANGSMRDALSLLDQGVAFGGGQVDETRISAMLGTIDRGHVTRIVGLLADQDGAGLLDEVGKLDESAPDYGAALEELMSVLQRIAIAQLVGGERLDDDDAELRELAARMTPEDVQLYYQIAVNGLRDIRVARDERTSFEMTLLRMLAFTLEAATTAAAGPAVAGRSSAAARPAPATPRPESRPESRSVSRPASAGASGRESAGDPDSRATTAPAAAAGTVQSRAGSLEESVRDWPALLLAAGFRGPVRSLAEHCVVAAAAGNRLELTLASDKADFNTEKLRERLRTGLGTYLGADIRLSIAVGAPDRATPAQLNDDSESRRLEAARQALERDPTVRAVQAAFDAVLEPDSIEPAPKSGRQHHH